VPIAWVILLREMAFIRMVNKGGFAGPVSGLLAGVIFTANIRKNKFGFSAGSLKDIQSGSLFSKADTVELSFIG